MQNPWRHDQVPDDAAVRRSRRWVKIIGLLMWLIIGSVAGVFIFTDIGGARATAVMIQVLQLTTYTIVICVVGWIIHWILRRIELLNGVLVNLFSVLFVFGLPVLVGIVAIQMGFLDGVLSSELSDEISKVAPIDRWESQISERVTGPIEDALPWQ